MKGGADIEVFMRLPKTPAGQNALEKALAQFHAAHAQKQIAELPCPTEQKLALMDAIIKGSKSKQ